VPRMVAGMDTMRRAWRGDLAPGGARQDLPPVPVRPLPAQPGGPPLWIGAMSEPAIKRAGRLADGFMATEVTPAELAQQAALARQEFVAAGRAGEFPISMHLPVFAWDGPDGWDLVRDSLRYHAWKYEDMEHARGRAGEPRLPPPMTADDETALRDSIILGTPTEVAATIDEYRRAAAGDLVFVAGLYFSGLAWDVQRQAVRTFARHVAPLVRERAADDVRD
jgi:alkanesulfonate monooxygenase SsuD/methylene tetrahydromethanopterin reductase-like flavin-dependent oxidoreductase (luciferase family)